MSLKKNHNFFHDFIFNFTRFYENSCYRLTKKNIKSLGLEFKIGSLFLKEFNKKTDKIFDFCFADFRQNLILKVGEKLDAIIIKVKISSPSFPCLPTKSLKTNALKMQSLF